MPLTFRIANVVWLIFLVCWTLASDRARRVRQSEPFASYTLRMTTMTAASVLLFWGISQDGVFDERVLPDWSALDYGGLALTIAGVALAMWARVSISGNWSADIVVKDDHRLVSSGPYAWVRHPIYSGMLLGLLGTALILSSLRAALGFALFAATLTIKAHREEKLMLTHFGADYENYRALTGFLIPFL